ncbi:MAG: SH3 domain-containing protein [Gemmataceae bacterium]
MRPTLIVGGIVGALCCIWTVRAQLLSGSEHNPADDPSNSYPCIMTVTRDNIYAHSGGDQRFHKTHLFQKNDKVHVLRKSARFNGDWLEIKPPTGSFNWIPKTHVKIKRDSLVAIAHSLGRPKVEILVGSNVPGEQINGTWHIDDGTEVVRLPHIREMIQNEIAYIAIDVLPNQVHYIPEESVEGSQRESMPSNLVPEMTPAVKLVAHAEKALQANHLDEAENFLVQAMQESSDPSQKKMIAKRRDEIQEKKMSYVRPGKMTGPIRLTPTSGNQATQAGTYKKTTTLYRPAGFSQTQRTERYQDKTIRSPHWSGWGYLQRSPFQHPDGRRIYQLVTKQESVITYAMVTSDRTLEPLVGKYVSLGGPTMVNARSNSIRTEYMLVTSIAQP